MRTTASVLLVFVLLALALLPWVVSSCASEPLLPPVLEEERNRYEETVSASQDATIEAMRQQESTLQVVVMGPIGDTPASPGVPVDSATETPAATASVTVTLPVTRSVLSVATVALTQTMTPTQRVIVVRSDSPPQPTATPTATSPAPTQPMAPSALTSVQDTITDRMLTDQVKTDAQDTTLADLTIRIQDEGFQALATVSLFPGIKRPIEIRGTFAVERESLTTRVSSILLDGMDVTEQYRWQLEDNVNTSLYRLLPQRYVRSFELSDGQIIVNSEMRP